MLGHSSVGELSISEVDLDLLGELSMPLTVVAPLTAQILMDATVSMPMTLSGAMIYSRPIAAVVDMSMTLQGAPLLYRPLGAALSMSMTLDGEMTYSRPIAATLSMPMTLGGQMVYSRPIATSLTMSMTGQGSLLTAILMALPQPGANLTLDMSLFSGFVESTGIELDPIPRATSEYPELWTREPLQYVGVIDVNDQLIEAELSGRTYYLGVSWNEEMGEWTLSIRNLDEQILVSGIALIPLYPLLRQYRREDFPPGELIVAISGANRQDLHRNSFKNGEAVLFYVEPEDLADGAL